MKRNTHLTPVTHSGDRLLDDYLLDLERWENDGGMSGRTKVFLKPLHYFH